VIKLHSAANNAFAKAFCGQKKRSLEPAVIDLDQHDRLPALLGCQKMADVALSGSS
jgi:hypothetical protein